MDEAEEISAPVGGGANHSGDSLDVRVGTSISAKMFESEYKVNDNIGHGSVHLRKNLFFMSQNLAEEIEGVSAIVEFIKMLTLQEMKNAEGLLRGCKTQSQLDPYLQDHSRYSIAASFAIMKEKIQQSALMRLQTCQSILSTVVEPLNAFYSVAAPKYKRLYKRALNISAHYDDVAAQLENLRGVCAHTKRQYDSIRAESNNEKNLRRAADRFGRSVENYYAELQGANEAREKMWKEDIPILIMDMENLERDRLNFVHSRLALFSKLHKCISDEASSILQLLSECNALVHPRVGLEKWVSSFLRQHEQDYKDGEEPTFPTSINKMEKPFEWNLDVSLQEVRDSMKEISTMVSDQDVKRNDGEEDLWADLELPNTTEDEQLVFCTARDAHRNISLKSLRFNKGEVIRLTRIPSKSDQTWYGEILGPCPPFRSGWFPKRFVTVNVPTENEPVPFAQCMYLPLGHSYFTEYLKAEHSETQS
eukprot:TRINITY_DN10336_c0_g1_i1.p1 TRINITY_DN10336_c0_g1~~TRINITY_DN10336_c0_g1_i1.p1  ORF type:complete len:506 (-),score=107.52 TRINITY_DN10336_c0_g1_i1:308-1741(-)